MSLAPSLQVNFDGVGLSDTVLIATDAVGVAHLHKIKPGSEVVFDLEFTGIDFTAQVGGVDKYEFRIEFRDTNSQGALLMVGNLPAQTNDDVVVTVDPTGGNTSRVRFTASAAKTAALDNRSGDWGIAVADNDADWQDTWVRGIWQTEPRPVKGLIDVT